MNTIQKIHETKNTIIHTYNMYTHTDIHKTDIQ